MRIIYAVVMLIPVLHLIAVLATFRRIHLLRTNTQPPTRVQIVLYFALPLLWNAALTYVLLVTLPKAFGANTATVILFQPDVGWVAMISGIFAIVWGMVRTGIVASTLHQALEKQKKSRLDTSLL